MLIKMRRKIVKAQASLEYAALIGIVVGAIILMSVYMKRSVQGKLHKESDSIGDQFELANGTYNYNSTMNGGGQDVTYSVMGATSADPNIASVAGWVSSAVKPGIGGQAQYNTETADRKITEDSTTSDSAVAK